MNGWFTQSRNRRRPAKLGRVKDGFGVDRVYEVDAFARFGTQRRRRRSSVFIVVAVTNATGPL